MRRTLLILMTLGCFVGTARGQTGVINLSVTSTPTPIVLNMKANYVVVQENSAAPVTPYTITLPGSAVGVLYAAGTRFVFTADTAGFQPGQTIGTISQAAGGTVSFVAIESLAAPTVPAATPASQQHGGGANPAGSNGDLQTKSGSNLGGAHLNDTGSVINSSEPVNLANGLGCGGSYGTSGQVLTSGGSSASPCVWSTAATGTPTGSTGDIQTKASSTNFGASHLNDTGSAINATEPVNLNSQGASGNAALKNNSTDAIRYVSPNGNDANDGLSWGTAKATVDAGITSLPGGTSNVTIGSGTVYVASGANICSADGSYGIQIMGANDPNFGSPPTCWLKDSLNAGQGLTVVGVGGFPGGPNSHTGRAGIAQTHGADNVKKPWLWLSATNAQLAFQNLTGSGPGSPSIAGIIGECSNGTTIGTCSSATINLDGSAFTPSNAVGTGPGLYITGNSFWIFAKDLGASGTFSSNPSSPGQSAAVWVDGTSNSGNGLIDISNFNFANGGLYFIPGSSENGLSIRGTNVLEGDFVDNCPPAVEITNGTGASLFDIQNVTVADCSNTTPAVQVDAGVPDATVVSNVQGQNVNTVGPMVIAGLFQQAQSLSTTDPLAQGQVGFSGGYVSGRATYTARLGSPSSVRFANQVSTNATTWTTSNFAGVNAITTGQPDPFGGTNAAKATSTSSTQENIYPRGFGPGSFMFSTGTQIVFKALVQGPSSGGFSQSNTNALSITLNPSTTGTSTQACSGAQQAGDGEWTSQWCVATITNGDTFTFSPNVNFDNSHAITLAYPYVVITSGLVNNELYEFAEKASFFDSTCQVGQSCPPAGLGARSLGLNGSTSGTFPLTVNSTASTLSIGSSSATIDTSGNLNVASCVGCGSGAPGFSTIGSGTNTAANMVIGTGASLGIAGSGTINATSLNSTTFASPAAIGTGTPAAGTFTALTDTGLSGSGTQCVHANNSGILSLTGTDCSTANSAAFNSITTGSNTQAAMTVGTGASIATSGSGTIAATSAPFSGLSGSTNTTAAMVLGTGSSLTFSGTGSINASKVNGTTIPASSAADQVINTTASGTGQWTAVPSCLDSGGNHLNYNTTTHLFSCGTSGGTAGSAAFNTITAGTNSSAAMVVGTGSSLGTSGSGTITATASPFAGLTTGTNTTATMTVGTGGSIARSGTGHVDADTITGTAVPTNSAADQLLGTTAAATGQWATVPSCLDSGGNHLNYNVTTHAFSCGTSGGTAGSAAFNTITAGTNSSAAMVVGTGSSLTTSGSGTITATSAPFSGLTGSTNTSAAMLVGTGGSLAPTGSGTINANQVNATTVPTNAAADQTIVTTAAATGSWASLPSCLDTAGQHINYNTTTHLFSCGTSSSGSGTTFATLGAGTNTSSSMVCGTGCSISLSGTGTNAATTLESKTFEAPNPIGTTTPAAGNFTSIGATTVGSGVFSMLTANTSLSINGGTALTTTNRTGTGNLVLATSPTLTTPILGVATGTSLNLGATGTLSTTAQSGTGSLCMTTNCVMTAPNIGAASGTSLSVSGQLTSTVATGTSPLAVTSTTNVANLNASSLNGATFASPGAIGGTTPNTVNSTDLKMTGPIECTTAPCNMGSQTNPFNNIFVTSMFFTGASTSFLGNSGSCSGLSGLAAGVGGLCVAGTDGAVWVFDPVVAAARDVITDASSSPTQGSIAFHAAYPELTPSPKVYTIAAGGSQLPAASGVSPGTSFVVGDATSFTPGTCTGGGSDYMIAISNGTTYSCH